MVDQSTPDLFAKILIAVAIFSGYVFLVALAAAFFYRIKPHVAQPSHELINEPIEPNRSPRRPGTRIKGRPFGVYAHEAAASHAEVRYDNDLRFVDDVKFCAVSLAIFVAAIWAPPFFKVLSTRQQLMGFEIVSGNDGALPGTFPNIQITTDIVPLITLGVSTLVLYFVLLLCVIQYSKDIYYRVDSFSRWKLGKWRSVQMEIMIFLSILFAEVSVFVFHDLRSWGTCGAMLLIGGILIMASRISIRELDGKYGARVTAVRKRK